MQIANVKFNSLRAFGKEYTYIEIREHAKKTYTLTIFFVGYLKSFLPIIIKKLKIGKFRYCCYNSLKIIHKSVLYLIYIINRPKKNIFTLGVFDPSAFLICCENFSFLRKLFLFTRPSKKS